MWRAANYLSVGQTYLYDNPLLKKRLRKEHVKPRLVGHWGTTPGLNFIYVHLNRVIKERDLNMKTKTLTPELLRKVDAWWRAANYLSVGQIYLYDNPLLKKPLKLAHIKPRLLGHWGTTPGLNFIYVYLN